MKTPLILLTTVFALSFLDGAFSWGLSEGFYIFAGLSFMVAIAWMWIIETTK